MDKEDRQKIIKNNRMLSDFPCLEEKQLVDSCFNRTRFDKDACAAEIVNYKTCKSFWAHVEAIRRKAGIRPAKPNLQERKEIKAFFLEHKKLPPFIPKQDSP